MGKNNIAWFIYLIHGVTVLTVSMIIKKRSYNTIFYNMLKSEHNLCTYFCVATCYAANIYFPVLLNYI